MDEIYDEIGVNYNHLRRPDPRIAALIHAHLGGAQTVLNVGAGTGSYEPNDRSVTAVEPSAEMIAKRPPNAAPVVQARADDLPFEDDEFDAAMAVLTLHHWPDVEAGLREVRRVTRGRIVIMTFDATQRPWLTEYLPELASLDEAQMPTMDELRSCLGAIRVEPVPIPHNCTDGFLYAYWRRPEAYLDLRLRSGSSSFWALNDVEPAFARLQGDLDSGAWYRRYAELLDLEAYDAGYRLVIANPGD